MRLRIATFNLENFDSGPGVEPPLSKRIDVMRPQLERINADILCLQEVHAQQTANGRDLSALDQLLAGTPYAGYQRITTVKEDGTLYDKRNIVTLSRLPVIAHEMIRDEAGPRMTYSYATIDPETVTGDPEPLGWARPFLRTDIDLGQNRTLHLINLHMKSKIATDIPGRKIDPYTWESPASWAEGSFVSAMKRLGQALQVRLLIDRLFSDQGISTLIVAAGDFNADTEDVPLRAIRGLVEDTGNPDHAVSQMIPCENNISDSSRYSFLHLGQGEMIDHLLASRAMMAWFKGAEIHNEALPDESGAFRMDHKFPESDHAPVVAEFEIRG